MTQKGECFGTPLFLVGGGYHKRTQIEYNVFNSKKGGFLWIGTR